jgi:alpha-L-fucosidase 2
MKHRLMTLYIVLVAFAFAVYPTLSRAEYNPLAICSTQPTSRPIEEGFPIGNGRLGALICGGVAREQIPFNQDSLWTGAANPTGNYDSMGAYQAFGNVILNFPDQLKVTAYTRELDLSRAIARVTYTCRGVQYTREYFCSHPAGLLLVRLTADRPAAYTGSIELNDAHKAPIAVDESELVASGFLPNRLQYESRLLARNEGGTLNISPGRIEFKNCDSLTLYLAAGTNYAMDYTTGYHGPAPRKRLFAQIAAASAKAWDELLADHESDFKSLFGRVILDLGPSTAAQRELPTDRRKLKAAETIDPELETLLFQYGRYLLISCSRPGGVAANLQGLWNDSNDPPWHCDYHTNINVQMSYWLAEPANLPECAEPLLDLVRSQLEPWRRATANSRDLKTPDGKFSQRGFAVRTSHNIFGGMGWDWDKTASAWYCQHFWEHYAFGMDKKFLAEEAYPILKETCQFWQDHLKALPDGRLVVPDGWSPEHGPHEDGCTYNQEIVWDLFNNYIDASKALGIDPDYRVTVTGLRDRLVSPRIGKWGQLQEWMTDRDDPNDHHRHTSHLFAVFPGREIADELTPALADGARTSLTARSNTGDIREWSLAWRTALWARLHEGDKAHEQLQLFFAEGFSCPNLLGLHPPMQMDGNFGITAGIVEILLQSQAGEINLLPALPVEWPIGQVTGLRARGGYTVDIAWKNWRLDSATIHAAEAGPVMVRYGKHVVDLNTKSGDILKLDGNLKIQ